MARPGVEVLSRDTAPPRSTPTTSDVAFIVGMTEKGPHDRPVLITSLDAYVRQYGARVSYGFLYDWLDIAFREGLSRAYIGRVVGPSPVSATVNIFDQSGSAAPGDVALVATAVNSGTWANTLNVTTTVSGSDFQVIVTDDVLGTLETSPLLADRQAAVDWSQNSDYIRLALGASAEDPRAQSALSLAGGTDDHASATDATWENALGLFATDLGPGQVCQPGRTTSQAHTDLLEHAAAHNRKAVCDGPNSTVKATVAAAPDAVDGLTIAKEGAGFAPWPIVAGTAPGTTRTVPPSAVVCGRIAATDAVAGVNQPAAGEYGISVTALDLTATFTDTDAEELGAPDEASITRGAINLLRIKNGQVRISGWRTFAEKTANPNHWMFSNERLEMQIKAEAGVIGDRFLFRQIDGAGITIGAWRGALEGMLQRFFLAGALYADPDDPRPETAFYVDVGNQINTAETIANGELHAVLSVRMSPFAELVQIEVVKVPVTMSVA